MSNLPQCKSLVVERRASQLFVTINRPDTRNALSADVVAELDAVAGAIADDRTIRSLILRGADGTFCAGADLKSVLRDLKSPPPADGPDPLAVMNRSFGEFLLRFNALPQTVVTVVEGAAFGGGLGLVCVSDVTICMHDARFALSETSLGIPPAQIAPFVVDRVGRSVARRLALTGARFDGRHGFEIGLVHFVCETGDEMDQTLARVLGDIDRCAPGAIGATKEILLASGGRATEQVLDDAARAFSQALRGDEGREGVSAFVEKRTPNWVEGQS